jgi:hypothetical protein
MKTYKKTYKKKGYSRNYKRKKYTRNYRNVRRSKRLMQKAGVFSSRFSSRSIRVAPAPYTHTHSAPSLENPNNTTYYKTRMLNTLGVLDSLDQITANANKMDKQPLELLRKLQENFHVYYTHMLNISNESVKESLKQELQGIKDTIENMKKNTEMPILKSSCSHIEKEIHRINAIDL